MAVEIKSRIVVSSLAGGSRGGTQDNTGAGPRTTSGVTGPTAKLCGDHSRRSHPIRRFKLGERTIEPAGIGVSGPGEAAFEHILAVEMRALAVGCRAPHEPQWPAPARKSRCRFGIAGLRAKKPSSGSAGVWPVALESIVAAQLDPIRVADRRHRGQSVQRAAQNDHQEARIAAFGARRFGTYAQANSAPEPTAIRGA